MTEGTIVKWHFAEGEEVAVGDTLFEMETDKAIMSVESMEDGFLAKILLGDGESAEPDAPIAVICEERSDVDAFRDYRADGPVEPATFAWQGFLKDPAAVRECGK